MTEDVRDRIREAVVQLPKLQGKGVLVTGGFVLTAAHCLEWSGDGGMALVDHLARVETPSGASFMLRVAAVDLVADIAALVAPDNQQFPDDCEAFERWQDSVREVDLSLEFDKWCARLLPAGETVRFAVSCLTQEGVWQRGYLQRNAPGQLCAPSHQMTFIAPITSGTSGGPIVDGNGDLVGIVSNAAHARADGTTEGMQPIVRNALPRWVLDAIWEDGGKP